MTTYAALIALSALCAVPRPACAQGTPIVNLGPLPGDFESEGRGLSESGTAAGASLGVFPEADAIVLDGTVRTLSGLAGVRSFAFDVNGAGHVAGRAALTPGSPTLHAMVWTPGTGPIRLSSTSGAARALDASGFAVGHGNGRAWRWEYLTGAALDLGDLGGGVADAFDIGADGAIVGCSTNGANVRRAFLWTPQGGMTDLGALGGQGSSEARAVAPDGTVVGASNGRAFVWKGGAMRPLKNLPYGRSSVAEDVSGKGYVVGTATDSGGVPRAVVWFRGRVHDLNFLATPQSGWDLLQQVTAVNGRGDVVGIGIHQGRRAGFLIPGIAAHL